MKHSSQLHASLEQWLLRRFNRQLQAIQPTALRATSLDRLGLDSVEVFTLCGELERDLGINVDPRIVLESRTIGQLIDGLTALAAPNTERS